MPRVLHQTHLPVGPAPLSSMAKHGCGVPGLSMGATLGIRHPTPIPPCPPLCDIGRTTHATMPIDELFSDHTPSEPPPPAYCSGSAHGMTTAVPASIDAAEVPMDAVLHIGSAADNVVVRIRRCVPKESWDGDTSLLDRAPDAAGGARVDMQQRGFLTAHHSRPPAVRPREEGAAFATSLAHRQRACGNGDHRDISSLDDDDEHDVSQDGAAYDYAPRRPPRFHDSVCQYTRDDRPVAGAICGSLDSVSAHCNDGGAGPVGAVRTEVHILLDPHTHQHLLLHAGGGPNHQGPRNHQQVVASFRMACQFLATMPLHRNSDEDVLQHMVAQPILARNALACATLCLPMVAERMEQVVHGALRRMAMHDAHRLRFIAPLETLRDVSVPINAAFHQVSVVFVKWFLSSNAAQAIAPEGCSADNDTPLLPMPVPPLHVGAMAPLQDITQPLANRPQAHHLDNKAAGDDNKLPTTVPMCPLDNGRMPTHTDRSLCGSYATLLVVAPQLFRSLLRDAEFLAVLHSTVQRHGSMGRCNGEGEDDVRFYTRAMFAVVCWLRWGPERFTTARCRRACGPIVQASSPWADGPLLLAEVAAICHTLTGPLHPTTSQQGHSQSASYLDTYSQASAGSAEASSITGRLSSSSRGGATALRRGVYTVHNSGARRIDTALTSDLKGLLAIVPRCSAAVVAP